MLSKFKRLASLLKRQFAAPTYIYAGTDWNEASARLQPKGWNAETVLSAYRASWPDFTAQLQHGLPGDNHFLVALWAFDLAAHNRDEISVLDWGGGLGSYYALFKTLRPDIKIHYTCKDVPILAAEGAKFWPEATFITQDSQLADHYDFILLSSSLQYIADWQATLQNLAPRAQTGLLLSRCPITQAQTHLTQQTAYDSQFLGWVLNREELLNSPHFAPLKLRHAVELTGTHTQPKNAPPHRQGAFYFVRPIKELMALLLAFLPFSDFGLLFKTGAFLASAL